MVKRGNLYLRFGTIHLDPWRRDRYVVPKHRWGNTSARCVMAQKSAILIYFAAEVWHHTMSNFLSFTSQTTFLCFCSLKMISTAKMINSRAGDRQTCTERLWNDNDGENPNYSEKACRSATLPITDATWTGLESKAGLRGDRPGSNRLSHGTARHCRHRRSWWPW